MSKRRTILVVEDDGDLRRMWRAALSFEGFEVVEAGDGLDALLYIEQRPPDLVVLDLDLPRVSGLSVQQEIAAHEVTRHLPIVIVTGSAMQLDHLHVPCVLRKPIHPEHLVKAVQRCLPSDAPVARS